MALNLIIEKTPISEKALKALNIPFREHKFQKTQLICGPYHSLQECIDLRELLKMDDIHTYRIEPAQ